MRSTVTCVCEGGRFAHCFMPSFQMSGRSQERLGVMSATEVTRIADDESIFEVPFLAKSVASSLHGVDLLSVGPICDNRYSLPWHAAFPDALGHALAEHNI